MDRIEARIPDLEALRPRLLELARERGTPLYVYDPPEVEANLARFRRAFAAAGVDVGVYYAIKSNPHPGLLETVVSAGGGLDASSHRELERALGAGARAIVLTGPGKDRRDLGLALEHRERVVVHLESRRELLELAALAAARRATVRCGLRLVTRHQSRWSKFGMPLDEVGACLALAEDLPGVEVVALHFHGGTLDGPEPVVATLEEVGRFLRDAVPPRARDRLMLVDVGGGLVPEACEGVYPWNRDQTMSFEDTSDRTARLLRDEIQPRYEVAPVVPVEAYAARVATAFQEHVARICPGMALGAEPGKAISHSAMHLLFTVVDVKGSGAVIVDGGTNMVGWEKYEFFDYAPIFDLTRFAPREERPVLVYGRLCTPHDLWGYYARGRGLQVGDVLCMPWQGAYTYTLAQEFIRPVPPVARR